MGVGHISNSDLMRHISGTLLTHFFSAAHSRRQGHGHGHGQGLGHVTQVSAAGNTKYNSDNNNKQKNGEKK